MGCYHQHLNFSCTVHAYECCNLVFSHIECSLTKWIEHQNAILPSFFAFYHFWNIEVVPIMIHGDSAKMVVMRTLYSCWF